MFYGVILSLTNQLREFLILLSWYRKEGDHISITNQLREFLIAGSLTTQFLFGLQPEVSVETAEVRSHLD